MQAVPSLFQPDSVVVHYGEVGLKGRNRPWFEKTLARNIRRAVSHDERCGPPGYWTRPERVRRLFGRILLELEEVRQDDGRLARPDWRAITSVLRRVFGIAHAFPALTVEPAMDAIQRAAAAAVRQAGDVKSFAVKCKRSTKSFPFRSMDVQREVGASIQKLTQWAVNLDSPDLTLYVECVNQQVFVGSPRVQGPGGMPTGVAGRVVALLSGGIDSPVASYRLLRRGATVTFVHFHSRPYTTAESVEKVQELAGRVLPPGQHARLYLVPFAELQRGIATTCAAPHRILLYRRFMIRTAEAIARKDGALALVTGESLGQVASQTLENIEAIDAAARLPVLRPLIGLDKQEVIAEAERIGTFAVSIEPHDDCCSFLQPPNPATRATAAELDAQEAAFDVELEVARLLQASEVLQVNPRESQAPVSQGHAPPPRN